MTYNVLMGTLNHTHSLTACANNTGRERFSGWKRAPDPQNCTLRPSPLGPGPLDAIFLVYLLTHVEIICNIAIANLSRQRHNASREEDFYGTVGMPRPTGTGRVIVGSLSRCLEMRSPQCHSSYTVTLAAQLDLTGHIHGSRWTRLASFRRCTDDIKDCMIWMQICRLTECDESGNSWTEKRALAGSEVKRGQNAEAKAVAEAKTLRLRSRPSLQSQGRGWPHVDISE